MKWYEFLLLAVVLFLVYKRCEGYESLGGERMYVSGGIDGSLDNLYVPRGGRPAEFFDKFSPSDWAPQTPGYIFDDTVEMDV